MDAGLTVTEEALRVVVLEWLQAVWTPEFKKKKERERKREDVKGKFI